MASKTNARKVEIRKALKGKSGQEGLDYLVNEMVEGRTIRSSFIRDGIDKLGLATNVLKLDGIYAKKYNEFKIAYAFSAKDSKRGLEFEGSTYSKEAASKIINTVENTGAASERFKYRSLGETDQPLMGKLFKDMERVTEMGHEEISILIGQMSMALKGIQKADPKDKRIQPLKAMIAVASKIDRIVTAPEISLEELINLEKTALESDWDIGAEAQAIVDVLTGVKGVVKFTMEPIEINQMKQKKLAGRLAKAFQDVLSGNMDKFETLFKDVDITNLQGSPTIAQYIGAQIQDILDPEIKGRPKKATLKPKPSKKIAQGSGTVKRQKLKSGRLAPIKLTKPKKVRAKTSKVSMNNMIGVINSKLQGVVLDNMGPPALESRTGKFAQSVKVTEIIRTRGGFPSIGYSYQKDPYQVFESTSGTRFSDANRDPRVLIDSSIREIAAQMAIGRLYTRRV